MRALLAIALLVGTAEARPFMPRQPGPSVFVLAIARDTCTTYPVSASANSGTVSSVATASLCGTAAGTRVVCAVGATNSNPTDWGTISVAWSAANGSCTTFSSLRTDTSVSGNYRTGVWQATCSASFSGVGVTVTPTTGSTNAVLVASCDVLTNANGSAGNTNGTTWASGTAANTTVASVTAGSWVYVVAGTESASAVTPTGSTSEIQDVTNAGGPTVGATGVDTSGTGGSTQVGWSTSTTWGAISGVEIKKGL